MNITLVIPTKNRPHYIKRILTYYLSLDFKGTVVVLDSSDEEIAKDIRQYVNDIDKVNFIYKFSLGLPLTVIKENLDLIKTKYASFLGDDDYIIPTGILKSIKYLESHSDVAGCRGEGLRIIDSSASPDVYLKYKNFFNRIEESSGERIIKHFKDFHAPFFHVIRYEVFLKAYSSSPTVTKNYDRHIGDELLIAGLLVAHGKYVCIEGLHIVRTNSLAADELRDEWLQNQDTKMREIAIKHFTKKIATAISEEDSIKFEEAEKIAISVQDNPIFSNNTSKNRGLLAFLKSSLEFLHLLKICLALRDNIFLIIREISDRIYTPKNRRVKLKNLLEPDNFYHKEFIPVYMSMIHYDFKNNEFNID